MRLLGLIVLLGTCSLGLPAVAQKSGQDRIGVEADQPKQKATTKERPAFTRAAGQSFTIDLDTMDNHYSQWVHKDVSSLSAMKATLKIPRMGSDGKYSPYFTIRVETADGSYGLRIQKNPAKTDEFEAEAYTYNAEKKANTALGKYSLVVAVDKPLDILLAWKDSQLTAWLSDEAVTVPLPGPVTAVSISSATGEISGSVEMGQ